MKERERQTIANLRHVLAESSKTLGKILRNSMDPGIEDELSQIEQTLNATVETVDKNYSHLPPPQ